MRLYLIVGIFTALLYPLMASFLWNTTLVRELFGTWEGALLGVATGAVSSYVLWVMQRLAVHVSPTFRLLFIRLLGAEIVGTFSVVLMEVVYRLMIGGDLVISFGGFLTLQTPAFAAAFIAYHLAGLLVEPLIPTTDTRNTKRKK